MINGRKVLAIVPARGGSKGLPGKNIRPLSGRPLIAWTIDEARKSSYIDDVVVSSDDVEILQVAREFGAKALVRPPELATDQASASSVVDHCLECHSGFQLGVLLQPTSPLRTFEDINSCIETCVRSSARSCVSVVETDKSPYWMYRLGEEGQMQPLLTERAEMQVARRQDLPKFYVLNGAIYVFDVDWYQMTRRFVDDQTVAHIMPKSRSVDIDTLADFRLAEILTSYGVDSSSGGI